MVDWGIVIAVGWYVGGVAAYVVAGMLLLTVARRYLGDAPRGHALIVAVWPALALFWCIIGAFWLIKLMWKNADRIIEWQTRPRQ